MKLSGWWKSNKRTSTWAFHVSFFSTVFLCVCRLHLGHFAAGIFFHSSNSHKYICFGWIFFLRLAHIGGRSRTLPFFCCFTRMRTFRSAAICLQVLVQDYLLSAVKHTHTQSRTRMRDGIRKCREKKFAHVSWGKLFFPLSNVVSDKLRKVGRGGKWESEGEKRNWKTSIRCVILTIATHPKWSIPNVHVFEHMFGRSLSLCFFRRIAIVHLRAHKNRPFHFPSNSFCTLSHSHDKDVIDNQIKEIHWLKYLPIDDKVSERCSHLLPPAQKKNFFCVSGFRAIWIRKSGF